MIEHKQLPSPLLLQINGNRVPTEVYLLNKSQHRYVIKCYEFFSTKDHYVYVMERPEVCQDLFHVLREKGPLAEMEARRYFRQILEANINLEENGVLHRDLKPGNMLLDAKRDEIKLIDFGLASEVQYEPYNSFRGENSHLYKLILMRAFLEMFTTFLGNYVLILLKSYVVKFAWPNIIATTRAANSSHLRGNM